MLLRLIRLKKRDQLVVLRGLDETSKFFNQRRHYLNPRLMTELIKNELRKYDQSSRTSSLAKVQILSNGYLNTAKSFVLVFNSNRVLVNCGEGALRQALCANMKPSRLDNILLTRHDWTCTGGLNGFTNTLFVYTHENIRLHAPFDFELTKNERKKVYFDKNFPIVQYNYEKSGPFEDENMSVTKIDMPARPNPLTGHRVPVCSYLMTIRKPEPTFLVDQLIKFDVKPGPWIKEIKNGREYRVNENKVIKPADLLDYSNTYDRKLLILDCLHIDDLPLIQTHELVDHTALHAIVHISNSEILNHPSYLDWIKSYPNKDCIHIYLDEKHPNLTFLKIYETQAKLNLINGHLFKLLPMQLDPTQQLFDAARQSEADLQKQAKLVQAQTNMELMLKPQLKLIVEQVNKIDNRMFQQQIVDYYETNLKIRHEDIKPDERLILDKLKAKIDQPAESTTQQSNVPTVYPQVLFLGTASCIPGPVRNLSAILVHLDESNYLLMDCGEFTLGQLSIYYAPDQLDEMLTRIKVTFISHNHLDHYNGLYELIVNRHDAYRRLNKPYEKLVIFHPRTLNKFFNDSYLILGGSPGRDKLLTLVDLMPNEGIIVDAQYSAACKMSNLNRIKYMDVTARLNLKSMRTVQVNHVPYSYALILETKRDNYKLVYSGDCRPSDELVEHGKDCDLLVHECTFDNVCKADAVKKKHSTIGEAIDVSCRMRAKYTLLTHFSLRYGKITRLEDVNIKHAALAFDFMLFRPDMVAQLDDVLNELNVVFKENNDENESKRSKKLKSK